MIKEIVKEITFLSLPSITATEADIPVLQDLQETFAAHRAECVGMAANMIGHSKRIIVFDKEGIPMSMFNPEIVKKSDPYETEESCLSLEGRRKVIRYKIIKVIYQTSEFKTRQKTFTGFTAQVIQHEIDHCNGVII